MSELVVDTDAMRSHATALDGPVHGLNEAAQAAAAMALPDASFGILCSFMVPAVAAAEISAKTLVGAAAAAIDGERAAIRASAASYDYVEERITEALVAIAEVLP